MFDKWLREKMKARADKPYFPKDAMCYDFRYVSFSTYIDSVSIFAP